MKKLFYLIMTFAFVFSGPMMASADRVHVPTVYQYSSNGTSVNNYSTISVKNLSSEILSATIHFMATSQMIFADTLGSSVVQSAGKSVGTKIPGYGVWHVSTQDDNVWGSTTSVNVTKVEVETSATDHPYVEGVSRNSNGTGIDGVGAGPVAVNTLFISNQSTGPSGFVFPVYYRIRSWASTSADGVAGYTTIDNWGQ